MIVYKMPSGVQVVFFLLLQIFRDVVWRPGPSIARQPILSMSPRFWFILDVIMIYLLVLDDYLTSCRFTTWTKQLTKCCKPLLKLRVSLGACKTSLSPPLISYLCAVCTLWCTFSYL